MILTCGPFNHALTVITHLRLCLLSLRTRILILLANDLTEALIQMFLNCLEAIDARVLCISGAPSNNIVNNANTSVMCITILPVRNSEETFTSRL